MEGKNNGEVYICKPAWDKKYNSLLVRKKSLETILDAKLI